MALDPFRELGLPNDPRITDDEIRDAYRRRAAATHPDKHPDDPHADTKFALVREAYEILKDPERRRRHEAGEPTPAAHSRRGESIMAIMSALTVLYTRVVVPGRIIGDALEIISEQIAAADARREHNREAFAGLDAIEKSIKFKGGGEDLLAAFNADRRHKLEAQDAADALSIETLLGAVELLESGYEDVIEEAAAMLSRSFVSSSNWTEAK